jgi:hypothetical protein
VVRSRRLITCSKESIWGLSANWGADRELNVGSHLGDSTHYVNANDMLSLSLLQARLVDLKLPDQEGE